MKRLLLLSLCIAIVAASCDLVKELVKVSLPLGSISTTITAQPGLEFTSEKTVSLDEVKTAIDNAGFSVDVIEGLNVNELILTMSGGDGYTWDKVSEVTFTVEDGSTSNEVINLTDFASNSKVELNAEKTQATVTIPEEERVDVKDYLGSAEITYIFNLKLLEELTADLTLEASVKAEGSF